MLSAEIIKSRQRRLEETLLTNNLDAIAFNPGPSLTYLTGLHFHLMERPFLLIMSPGKTPSLVLPALEMRKLDDLPFAIKAFQYGEDPSEWPKAFEGAVAASGVNHQRVGVEALHMRVIERGYLVAASTGVELVPAEKIVAKLRMFKDETEVAAMQKAAETAEKALQATLPMVRYGMDEKELAGELVIQLLRNGSNPRMPFSPIVSAGPNSANPHATPTNRKLQAGDLLLIDWGAGVEGYVSDITRTFALGEVDPELTKISEIVQAANAAARTISGPGVPMSAVDNAARAVITDAGYGPYFTHRTGHGLGMEAHEEPYIRGDNDQPLEIGMTFTIEPGIYLPNRGGVRIEDDVLVTEGDLFSFSKLDRGLIQLL